MTRHSPRLTLIVLGSMSKERAWTRAAESTDLIFLDSFDALAGMMSGPAQLDIERVVLENGSAGAAQFLSLLASVGEEFSGDLLLIGGDGGGFLSAIGRGGERVLYWPSRNDVNLYLAVHGLTPPGATQPSIPLAAMFPDAHLWWVA